MHFKSDKPNVATVMMPIDAQALAAERLNGDDTTAPVLAAGRTDVGRFWTYVRDDAPFSDTDPPAAMFCFSQDRSKIHPEVHLANCTGILQADADAGFNGLCAPGRRPGPILEAACGARDKTKIGERRKGLSNLVEKSLAAFPMASGGMVNAGGND